MKLFEDTFNTKSTAFNYSYLHGAKFKILLKRIDQRNLSPLTKKNPALGEGNLGPIWAKNMQPYVSQFTL